MSENLTSFRLDTDHPAEPNAKQPLGHRRQGRSFKPQRLGWRFVSHLLEDFKILVGQPDLAPERREGITQHARIPVAAAILVSAKYS